MPGRIAVLALLAASASAAPCTLHHPAAPGDTLTGLATFYYGSQDYSPAILIGTNSRTSEGFPYVSNPVNLRKGDLCIPDSDEAVKIRTKYTIYEKAIAATAVAQPSQEAASLVVIPANQPVTVATWTRADQVAKLKDKAPNDIWVTVEPHLKEFCSAWAREHDNLTERLEQRLGLPPAAGETTFVRIHTQKIFRPCSDPATATFHCEAGPPSGKDPAYTAWFTGQYYSAFGLPRPNLYPWTSLGYTFDWAQGEDGEFKRFGESEFVIPKGAPIEVLGSMTTEAYCR